MKKFKIVDKSKFAVAVSMATWLFVIVIANVQLAVIK